VTLLRRDRVVVLAALAGVTAIAWGYLVSLRQHMAMATMDDMPGMVMPFDAPSTFAMWWVMMLGMMLPSAAPMILTFSTVQQRRRERAQPYVPTVLFVAGYLLVWGGFSLAATAAQWGLQRAALLSPMMAPAAPWLAGVLFIVAGVYQLTPLKYACLSHCRSPLAFVLNHWRDGWAGALRMGVNHGAYCLGCCWVLMALLFAVGVMNLLWVAAIAVFVLAEKLLPRGEWIGRIGGAAMTAVGVWMLVPLM
jgi:predicted metal-binding membrane protein